MKLLQRGIPNVSTLCLVLLVVIATQHYNPCTHFQIHNAFPHQQNTAVPLSTENITAVMLHYSSSSSQHYACA